MKKLLGILVCMCTAIVLSFGATGCTKTKKGSETKTNTPTEKMTPPKSNDTPMMKVPTTTPTMPPKTMVPDPVPPMKIKTNTPTSTPTTKK